MENTLSISEKENQLLGFVPNDTVVAPLEFIKLVSETILGRDSRGGLRPAADLKLFLYQCKRTGLDPLARQIFAIYRNNKQKDGTYKETMTIQTSIDGFRLVAERSGKYAGQSAPVFTFDEKGNPATAEVTVFKIPAPGATPFPTTAVASWDEYAQVDRNGNLTGLWAKMKKTMLAKVAEALALRKAFPQELSGLYTAEEMAQAIVVGDDKKLAPPLETLPEPPSGLGESNDAVTEDPAPSKEQGDSSEGEIIKAGSMAGKTWGSVSREFLNTLLINAKEDTPHILAAKKELLRRGEVAKKQVSPQITYRDHLMFYAAVYKKHNLIGDAEREIQPIIFAEDKA